MVVLAVILTAGISFFYYSDHKKDIIDTQNDKMDSMYGDIFVNLPEKDDQVRFDLIKRNFYTSQISDFSLVDENVWRRPEFYPTWERSGIITFTDHDFSRWGIHGYGFFPSEESWNIANMDSGDEFKFQSWFHTSWGVETWQGIQLVPIYDKELFDVSIEPNLFIIGPTYPQFDIEWTKLIQFKVTAKEPIPPGDYIFSVAVSAPSKEQENEWSWELLDQYTDGKLHDDIERCKSESTESNCDDLILQRQVRYVQGGMFTPSQLFNCRINVQ